MLQLQLLHLFQSLVIQLLVIIVAIALHGRLHTLYDRACTTARLLQPLAQLDVLLIDLGAFLLRLFPLVSDLPPFPLALRRLPLRFLSPTLGGAPRFLAPLQGNLSLFQLVLQTVLVTHESVHLSQERVTLRGEVCKLLVKH